MTKNDFYNLALIEAMGQAARGGCGSSEAAESAHRFATQLIKFYQPDDDLQQNDLGHHVMEVDENHGRILVEQANQIEQLQQTVANLKRIIEQTCPGWINTPALYGNEHK